MSAKAQEDLYLVRAPTTGPEVPDRWTWSALQEWRRCPRQWWLRRAHYSNADTPYPQREYVATVEGILLHHAIDAFAAHIGREVANGVTSKQEIRASFPARKVIQQKLREALKDETNPRTDVPKLLARVSIDRCVNAFRVAASACVERVEAGRSRARGPSNAPQPRFGTEVPIAVTDPPLGGRLDYFTPHGIVDFKTGAPDPSHHEQLRFYAMMIWLITSKSPAALSILYVHENRDESVAVPTQDELQQMAQACRSEITTISEQIVGGVPPAMPSEVNCRMCSVRQLCDPYWVSPETNALRLTPDRIRTLGDASRSWSDAELIAVPPTNRGGGYVGRGIIAGGGEVDVSIGRSQAVDLGGAAVDRVRMLNALVELRNGVPCIGATRGSEVFWVPKSAERAVASLAPEA